MRVYRCPLWVPAQPGGAKAWLHVQDFEVNAAFDLGLLRGKRLRRWVDAAKSRLLAVNWVDVSALGGGLRPPGRINSALQAADGYRAELGIAADAVVALTK